MEDEQTLCEECGIHFANAETLQRHMAAIHKTTQAVAAPVQESVKPPPRPDLLSENRPSENVELAPLLGVLSEAQKDALLLRAVQREPEYFYDRILEQATMPLTDDDANSRLTTLDSHEVSTSVRCYVAVEAVGNALTLLSAASQRCLTALEALGDDAASEKGADESDDSHREELLAAVEASPAVGVLGVLWAELLGNAAARTLVGAADGDSADAIEDLLEALQEAAAKVRGIAPALLVGPEGEKIDSLAGALRELRAAANRSAQPEPKRRKKS